MKENKTPREAPSVGALILIALVAGAAHASDGEPDTEGRFPAVAGYYEFFVYLPADGLPEVVYAELSCSGALVSEKVVLTACTARRSITPRTSASRVTAAASGPAST